MNRDSKQCWGCNVMSTPTPDVAAAETVVSQQMSGRRGGCAGSYITILRHHLKPMGRDQCLKRLKWSRFGDVVWEAIIGHSKNPH